MELSQWFNIGLTKEEYISGMKVNKDEMNKIYSLYRLNEQEKEQVEKLKGLGLRAIVLTEDWCGDAMLNIPILLRIAEEANIDVRYVLRDSNLELMDQYLTNGTSRSIPIFIFIDEKGEERAVWGPRAPQVQEFVTNEISKLPGKEDPEFKEQQLAMFKTFKERYQVDEDVWHVVAESILSTLSKL